MKTALRELVFPHSWEPGAPVQGINYQRIRQMAASNSAVSTVALERMIEDHHCFLSEGGAGGQWQTLLLGGLVVAIYEKEGKNSNQQFSLEYRRLEAGVSLAQRALPFSNCCAALLENLPAQEAILSHSLFTDALLIKAHFERAQLQNVDFSRADLRQACFSQADLSGADFENCDLRGADFRGARIVGARFPGAQLDGVLS